MSRTTIELDVRGALHAIDFGGPSQGVVAPVAPAPVILVHGMDGSAANWWDIGEDLANDRRVVAIDLPGYGRSRLHGRSSKMAKMADLTIEAARQVTDRPVHLVGNSMGGVVVLLAAARHPDAVAQVSLVAPAVPRAGKGRIAWSFVPWLAPFYLGLGSAESRRRMAQDPARRVEGLLRLCYAAGSATSPDALAEMIDVAAQRNHRDAVKAWTTSARDLFGVLARRGAFHAMASSIAAPVHMIEGVADPIIPPSSILDSVQRHGWQHTRLDGVGHAPMLEAPARTLDAIRASQDQPAGNRSSAEGVA